MPFDPAQPADHSDLDSQVMRNQLNALKALIDAAGAGSHTVTIKANSDLVARKTG